MHVFDGEKKSWASVARMLRRRVFGHLTPTCLFLLWFAQDQGVRAQVFRMAITWLKYL